MSMLLEPALNHHTPTAAPAPRVDLYAVIHKALRLFMTDTLGSLGWFDPNDADECHATLDQADALLALCHQHLLHENRFVHPAIEARQPGGSAQVAREHVAHAESIKLLQAEVAALRASPNAAAAHRLYRQLALFIGENFKHMNVEETEHNARLWAHYSDDELNDVHERLLASIAPQDQLVVLRWMVPALPPADRAALLRNMQTKLPADVMAALMASLMPHLSARAWDKLMAALQQR
jgi:hemerythrin-like domain-containing protein